ncbi:MAG: hypothetical protein Q4C96_01915 [Planctomycetia bacterium]|nr:hypothetical protein [Planctomycetia bacterium]
MSTSFETAKLIGVIDIGSNSIRLALAHANQDGTFDVFEKLHRGVWLGKDTFRRGALGSQAMKAAIDILKFFHDVLKHYGVTDFRVLATTAIREASNADFFVERVRLATNLEVEVIDATEEVQFTATAVMANVQKAIREIQKPLLLADVGGGSTLLTILQNSTVINSQTLNLGSVQLQEMLADTDATPGEIKELMLHAIQEILDSSETYFPMQDAEIFIATGGDARFAAEQVGTVTMFEHLKCIPYKSLEELTERCARYEPQRLCHKFGIPLEDAETLVPALLTYLELLSRTQAKNLLVSSVSMRDGVLLALARDVWGRENISYREDILDSAKSLAAKFHIDISHAQKTSALAERIFDELRPEHGLGSHHRLLLSVTALLQHAGRFLSNRAFHKHSYYLIANSEIFGLRRTDLELVALTARYSRRGSPKISHPQYMALPRQSRLVVSKLAAILRIADSLNHGECPAAERIRFQREGDELILHLPPQEGFLLKLSMLESQGKMFEDVFGIRVSFED